MKFISDKLIGIKSIVYTGTYSIIAMLKTVFHKLEISLKLHHKGALTVC
jgi:hypothetical protein